MRKGQRDFGVARYWWGELGHWCTTAALAVFVFLMVLELFVEFVIATKYLSQIFQGTKARFSNF